VVSAPRRVVLDTHVALELWYFADPRVAPLRDALEQGAIVAVADDLCRAEWRRVLRYPALRIATERALELDAHYDARMQRFERGPAIVPAAALPRCADPDDQKFLELARDAGAEALLTRDAALLALAARTQRRGLFRVLTPDAFLPPDRAEPA
jgi:predicted nucleic acid-binding protein